LLKQPQFQPLTWQQQAVVLFAGTQGYLDDVQVTDIRAFEDGLYKYLDNAQTALIDDLTKEKKLDNLRDRLHAALKDTRTTSRQNWPRQRHKSSGQRSGVSKSPIAARTLDNEGS